MKINILERNIFDNIVKQLNLPEYFNYDVCYEIYCLANEAIESVYEQNQNLIQKDISQVELIYYTVGETLYACSTNQNTEDYFKSDDRMSRIASVVGDKYLSLSIFNITDGKLTNKFLPPASTLDIYINFMLNILNSYKKNDPQSTLIVDLLNKSAKISRSILELLVNGHETEAFATWRTLHECECSLIILDKYGDDAINGYLKHMNYGLAFNDNFKDKEEQTRVFNSMKAEMKQYDLKSKDIKKYIEYGWLYNIEDFKKDDSNRLNFRDGLEKLAGLNSYSERYELSSEIIHSTPLLIYSRKDFFYYLTLLSLYESFFRLEKVFVSLISQRVSKEQFDQYLEMRKLYYSQLTMIHKNESEKFNKLQNKK